MIMAYKALEKDLSCTSGGNRFQYVRGIWNEEPQANCRKNGFHCAENPLDCLNYYPFDSNTVFYLVLADGDIDEDAFDSKISCTRIKLVKPLKMEEFVAHSLNYVYRHPFRKNNCRIQEDKGIAQNGFMIVRGKNPTVKGQRGDILGLVEEEPNSRKVSRIAIYVVDGIEILPDTWYGIDGKAG